MSYIVEKLTKDHDYKQVLGLLAQLTSLHVDEISYEKYCEHFDKLKADVYVVMDGKNIVGTGSILIEPKFIHDLSYVAHIEDVVVAKDCRGSGLGKLIIDHLVGIAKKNNCYKVILNCREENIKFYEKCGFKNNNLQMSLYF
jgi:glucosamine-phosphate N-acetyltransferase